MPKQKTAQRSALKLKSLSGTEFLANYKKQNLELVELQGIKKSTYYNAPLYTQMLQRKETAGIELEAKGAKIIDLVQALAIEEIAGSVYQALEAEPPAQNQFEAYANANFVQGKVIVAENARVELKVKVRSESVEKLILIARKASFGTTEFYLEINGTDSLSSPGPVPAISTTILCPREATVTALNVPAVGGLYRFVSILNEGAVFSQSNVWLNGEKTKAHYSNVLHGKRAIAKQSDVLLLSGTQESHIAMTALHRKPEGFSETKIKCVLRDTANQSFDGMIKIMPGAQKTQSYLEANSMLLSNDAKSVNIPKLEIEADDVKATHSATVEHLDEEKTFYLQSRGLNKKETEKIVVASFLEGALVSFPESIKERVKTLVDEKIGN